MKSSDLITEARELCADAQLEAALLELKTMSGWLNKVVYHKLGIRWSFDNNNLIHWIVVFMRLLLELCDALEKAQEQNKQLMHEVCKLACESVEREKTLAKLEAEVEHAITATRWIPVAERLPDYDVPVLVTYLGFTDNKPYSDGIARWVLEMNGYTGGWEWTLDGDEVEVTITHWMPLPAPPKEG
jgi:hypothetical protein